MIQRVVKVWLAKGMSKRLTIEEVEDFGLSVDFARDSVVIALSDVDDIADTASAGLRAVRERVSVGDYEWAIV
jgi:hypothetical protein